MGTYLDPGNSGFAEKSSAGYVDKTSLICLINQTIDTGKNLVGGAPRGCGLSESEFD